MLLRLSLSLALFLGLLGIVSWLVLQKSTKLFIPQKISQDMGDPEYKESLFYSSVGDLPELTSDKTLKAEIPHYTVEIGIFHTQPDAEAEISKLRKLGLTAFYSPFQKGAEMIFRVRIGIISQEDAQNYLAELEKLGIKGELVSL